MASQANHLDRRNRPSGRSLRPAALLGATLLLAGAPAWGAADLQITALSVQGSARVGNCNTLSMTVRNNGDQFTQTASIDIFVATYSQGASNQNRAEKTFIISPLQPGQQSIVPVSNVEFKAAGGMTIQALVDSTQEVTESNENNNGFLLNTNVSGSCSPTPTPPPVSACDLSAQFVAPTGSTVTGPNVSLTVEFKNESQADCPGNKVKLMRYNGTTCSGYGTQVGGSRALFALQALRPGATQRIDWRDERVPAGKYCYKMSYSSPHNDANNNNHHPQKKLAVQ